LRQNRDIARINSDQSQKIRRLENDCARLLSENLELRAQIVRLEKKLEENTAQRIADHALEVKAKLEAQLAEFSSLISSLGVEPAPKRRALERQPQRSLLRSPPQRRRRTSEEEEALAEAEGRLPPIFENKPYPRATMKYVI
jgi:Shugoshin N-terminal coiled-coil region.